MIIQLVLRLGEHLRNGSGLEEQDLGPVPPESKVEEMQFSRVSTLVSRLSTLGVQVHRHARLWPFFGAAMVDNGGKFADILAKEVEASTGAERNYALIRL